MRPVATAAEAREMDRRVIVDQGLPGICLMESASRAVAEAARELLRPGGRVVAVCGPGNNGGDGYGAARWLRSWGIDVATWSLAPSSRGDAAVMRAASLRAGVPEVLGLDGADLVVDAVFGTGLDREITGAAAEVLQAIDACGAPVVAVDLPSGVHSDTGAVLGVAPRAAITVTFGCARRGAYAGEGPDLCGELRVADIGLGGVDTGAELPDDEDLLPLWPRRAAGAHKGDSGHLLVIAGSRAMAGAAVLACRGALAGGAGLVTLCAPAGALARLAALPPEVMVLVGPGEERLEALPEGALRGRAAVVAGPGLGGGAPLGEALSRDLVALWERAPVPVAFDADALACAAPTSRSDRLVTPHPGEAGRLLGTSAAAVQGDRFAAAAALAARAGVGLLKGRHTLVAAGSAPISVNPTGCAVLATGGSGDVLVGLLGALLARGVPPRDAARLAAWAHGRAADRLSALREGGWTAGDVADAIAPAVESRPLRARFSS